MVFHSPWRVYSVPDTLESIHGVPFTLESIHDVPYTLNSIHDVPYTLDPNTLESIKVSHVCVNNDQLPILKESKNEILFLFPVKF